MKTLRMPLFPENPEPADLGNWMVVRKNAKFHGGGEIVAFFSSTRVCIFLAVVNGFVFTYCVGESYKAQFV